MPEYMFPAFRRVACYCAPRIAGVTFLWMLAWHGAVAFRLQGQPCTIDRVIRSSQDDECRAEFSILGGWAGEEAVASAIAGVCLATAAVRLLLVGVHIVPVICRVWRGACRRCSAKDLQASFILLGKTAKRLVSTCVYGSLDPVEARVCQEVTRLRIQQARANIRRIGLLLAPIVFTSGHRVFARENRTRSSALIYIYDSEAFPLLCSLICATLLDAVPSLVTTCSLDWCNVLLSAVWCWKFAVMQNVNFLYNETWILLCRIVQIIVCGNARLTMMLHGIVCTVSVLSFAQGLPPGHYKASRYQDLQVVTFVVISVVGWCLEQRHMAEAHALIRARQSDHASALVYSLLSAMCDAVAKLDADMRLTEPCPKLASLLLREGPQPPGMHFTGFMPAEDAEHFCEHVAIWSGVEKEEDKEEGLSAMPAHVLHTHLNDGNNMKLPVELFYSCVPDVHGQPAYLIGIKEQREANDPRPVHADPPTDRSIPTPNLGSLPESGRVDHSATSSSWSASAESDTEREGVYVWVDAASKDLSILGFSSSFAFLGGSSGPCAQLQEWASAFDTALLRSWLLQSPKSAFHLQLRPPAAGGQYKVSCRWAEVFPGNAPAAPSGSNPRCIVMKILTFSAESTSSAETFGKAPRSRRAAARGSLTPLHGGHEGSAVTNALQKFGDEEAVCLWFVIHSKHLSILKLYGRSDTYCRLFEANRKLSEWPERLEEFQAGLHRAIFEFKTGVNRSLPRLFGIFVFKVPVPQPPWPKFQAEALLLDVPDSTAGGQPCCVGLRAFRVLAPAAPAPQALGRPAAERIAL